MENNEAYKQWPNAIQYLFSIFKNSGFELYLVGGCVRDFFMQKKCNDYDMCTNATPEQMQALAHHYDVTTIPTGIKHGTITFIKEHYHIEITTYRQESDYEKHRFPKTVTFTPSLAEDSKRRDFTINAMAMNEDEMIDYHNGIQDIQNKCIRCVGNPTLRFQEDALRILRALRFAFQLSFTIEVNTKDGIINNASLLTHISRERVRDELNKMLLSEHVDILQTLREYKVLDVIIPEFVATYDVAQETPWHLYDVFTHMNIALNATKGHTLSMKLAILLHDIAKPDYKTFDDQGIAHFVGHAHASAKLAKLILQRLKYDKKTIQDVCTMIEYHDYYMYDNKKSVHKLMYKLNGDYNMAFQILKIQLADNLAKNQTICIEKNRMIYGVTMMLKEMQANHECFCISDLAISGHDLKALGYEDKEIGKVLQYTLKQIINQQDKNNKIDLLKIAGGYKHEITHH